jgi:hypothetical protein
MYGGIACMEVKQNDDGSSTGKKEGGHMDVTDARWEKAFRRVKGLLERYKNDGLRGKDGVARLCLLIRLYEGGDRSEALLSEMENVD